MPRIQIEVHPPTQWLIDFSETRPDDEFRVLASYPDGEASVWIIEVKTQDQERTVKEMRGIEQLRSFREIGTDEEVLLVECRGPESEVARLMSASGIAPQYPTVLRDGRVIATLTVSQERVSTLTSMFDSTGIEYVVRSLVQTPTSDDLLTSRQSQFIEKAMTHGYYETPRNCSLTDLASIMDVHKTTASETLHRAESRIIAEFVATRS